MMQSLDLDEFERMSGLDFTGYCLKMKDFQADEGFLKYFAVRKNHLDLAHLEISIWWLGKNKSLAAYHEIANFVGDPNASLRFLAIGFIKEMEHEIDTQIMSRLIEALENAQDGADRQSFNSIIKKPASKEAQNILLHYLSKSDAP